MFHASNCRGANFSTCCRFCFGFFCGPYGITTQFAHHYTLLPLSTLSFFFFAPMYRIPQVDVLLIDLLQIFCAFIAGLLGYQNVTSNFITRHGDKVCPSYIDILSIVFFRSSYPKGSIWQSQIFTKFPSPSHADLETETFGNGHHRSSGDVGNLTIFQISETPQW